MNRSIAKLSMIPLIQRAAHSRGLIFGGIILVALLAFEIFNYSSTSFALQDILGGLSFGPFKWATILAIAFCSIDFAGIARIFTPERGRDEPAEVWYLFGAWLLAAGFNATLTWWGVSVAIASHNAAGGSLVGQTVMMKFIPIFVAAMVWLVRVLIIGTFSIAGERLFTLADARAGQSPYRSQPVPQPRAVSYNKPAPRQNPVPSYSGNRPGIEPTYHPVGMSAMSRNENRSSSLRS
jgi:hypothetical protein